MINKIKLGGLYTCTFDRELFYPKTLSTKKTAWTKIGMLKANSLFIILEAVENKKLSKYLERGGYVDLKILSPTGQICYLFCYSDEFQAI